MIDAPTILVFFMTITSQVLKVDKSIQLPIAKTRREKTTPAPKPF
jgi:hypothetical protein